jgi:hypothetical protein
VCKEKTPSHEIVKLQKKSETGDDLQQTSEQRLMRSAARDNHCQDSEESRKHCRPEYDAFGAGDATFASVMRA